MLEVLPGIGPHQIRSALGAWLFLQGLQHPLHVAAQITHGGGAVHLPSPVDEVIDQACQPLSSSSTDLLTVGVEP